ncbi:MAG TPA: flagellin [Phycisphaeraceae bacterium]
MSRINTNVNSLIAQRILSQQNFTLNKSLERLSTGFRINRGGDDPAGLIASEALRSEKEKITAAIANAERADQVVNVAEGGLQEINSLLLELQGLVSEAANDAGLSTEEKEANQQQIDAILQTIDRIASTTSFQGTKLLNGTFDFTVSGQTSQVADFRINGAKIGDDNVAVNAVITQSAQHAGLFLSVGGTSLDLSGGADARFTLEIAGAKGSRQFSFSSGTATSDIAAQINTFKSITGVSAVVSGNGLVLKSTDFGSDQFVSVDIVDTGGQDGAISFLSATDENTAQTTGTAFSAVTNAIRDDGQDVGAIVNGITARGKGKELTVNTDSLDLSITLTTSGAQALGSFAAFTITGGGAKFNLGPTVDATNEVRLGIGNVAARHLGNATVGYLDQLGSGKSANVVDGDVGDAQEIIDVAIKQVSALRGRLGSFQSNVVQSTINALGVAYENISAAESVIRDTDFAAETAELTRSQVLVAAATNALSIANSNPQNVLRLLG